MVKIAFSGKFTSGKSTAAQIVADNVADTKIVSFAGKVKDIATDLFGMTKKDRNLLINIGMKMREIEPNVWLDYAIKRMDGISKSGGNVVNDDLRFPNEFESLQNKGFILVRLKVNKETQIQRLKQLYPDNWGQQIKKLSDESETALDSFPFDYYIDSDQGLDNLRSEILEIIRQNT